MFRKCFVASSPEGNKKDLLALYFSLHNRLPLVFDDFNQELVDESGVLDNGELDIDNNEEEEED